MVCFHSGEPRAVLLHVLAFVLRNIEADARKIAKQRAIVAKLDAGGHDISEALGKLAHFERVHALNIASHRRIMRELTAWTDTGHSKYTRLRKP
jgi:cell division protein FtsX